MKLLSQYLLIFVFYLISIQSFSQKVKVITSTPRNFWYENKVALIYPKTNTETVSVVLSTDSLLQEIDGFGGTFNELGWDAMQVLTPAKRLEVMQALFGQDGANLALGRLPVGASDYAMGYYSYCDVKEDFTMRDFSITRDRYILIPFVKEALKVKPGLKLWASPWTPPAWMKINEHYTLQGGDIAGRTGGNEMDSRKNVMGNVTAFNMQLGYLKAYALYFSKYIKAYQAEGINIWALMPQNEIAWSPNWPCCTWRPEDLAYFVGKYLGPQFKADAISTEIWLGTINYPDPNYVRTFLKNNEAADIIKGIGFQWTGAKAIPFIHKEYPKYNYMQTENICGDHENDWTSLERTWKAMVHYFHNGTKSYMYWNMVLDETGKSAWGWPQNSLIIVNKTTGEVNYTPEYFLMKHLSQFTQPGSRLIKTSELENTLAFRTADGKVTIVFYNPDERAKQFTFIVDGKEYKVTGEAKSVNSVIL